MVTYTPTLSFDNNISGKNMRHITLPEVINLIKIDSDIQRKTARIKDKFNSLVKDQELSHIIIEDAKKKLGEDKKRLLPIICSAHYTPGPNSGENGERTSECFERSNLFIYDVDALTEDELVAFMEKVRSNPHVLLGFRSPSSCGYKIAIPISEEITDFRIYKEKYIAVLMHLKNEWHWGALDPATCDAARGCYLAHDSECHVNEDAVPLDLTNIKPVEKAPNPKKAPLSPPTVNPPTPSATVTTPTTASAFCGRLSDSILSLLVNERIAALVIARDYDEWFLMGQALASEFGESGRPLFHRVSGNNPRYAGESPGKIDEQYDYCLENKDSTIGIGTLYMFAKRDGIVLDEIKGEVLHDHTRALLSGKFKCLGLYRHGGKVLALYLPKTEEGQRGLSVDYALQCEPYTIADLDRLLQGQKEDGWGGALHRYVTSKKQLIRLPATEHVGAVYSEDGGYRQGIRPESFAADTQHAFARFDDLSATLSIYHPLPKVIDENNTLFMDLLKSIMGSEDRVRTFLYFMALYTFEDRIKNAKPTLLLFGPRGTGKTLLTRILSAIFPQLTTNLPPNPHKHNTYLRNRLVLCEELDDASEDLSKFEAFLKRVSGSPTLTINPKGLATYDIANRTYFVVLSNHKPVYLTSAFQSDKNNQWVCLHLNKPLSDCEEFEQITKRMHALYGGMRGNEIDLFLERSIGAFIQGPLHDIYRHMKTEFAGYRYGFPLPKTADQEYLESACVSKNDEIVFRVLREKLFGDYVECGPGIDPSQRLSMIAQTSLKILLKDSLLTHALIEGMSRNYGITVSAFNRTLEKHGVVNFDVPKKTIRVDKATTKAYAVHLPKLFELGGAVYSPEWVAEWARKAEKLGMPEECCETQTKNEKEGSASR